MADKKISQLSAASSPLAGTEVLPIVQSGSTVKVSAADVTAGRAVSASSIAVTGSTAPANGVYLPAANAVGISTSSLNAVYIDSSGNVAIAGGNAPTQAFNLYRSGSTQTVMSAGNSNTGLNGTYFGVDTAGNAIINQTQALALNLQTSGITRVGIASTGNVTVSTGNLVVGTAGKGIDFSVNTGAAGKTSQLLDDYEEGTWTPAFSSASGSFGAITYDGATFGLYTKVGNLVTAYGIIRTDAITVDTASGAVLITGLPYVCGAKDAAVNIGYTQALAGDHPDGGYVIASSATMYLTYRTAAGGAQSLLDVSDLATGGNANRILFSCQYQI